MEPNDPLWQLLDKSRRSEPDAWFAARTLARCRREAAGRQGLAWPGWGWLTAGALAVMLLINILTGPKTVAQTVAVNASSKQVQEALNYVADRGGDVDLWLE